MKDDTDKREAKIKDMCRYLLWGEKHLDQFYEMALIAASIARELYPDDKEAKL